MDAQISRFVFAALCGVFFCAIAGVATWEWNRFQSGQSALSPRHFRWRMLSALVWLFVLGSFVYAMLALWPQNLTQHSPAQTIMAKRFAFVLLGSTVLMLLGFVFMAVDVFWTVQVGRRSALRRTQQSQDTLQRELERARKRSANQNGGPHGT